MTRYLKVAPRLPVSDLTRTVEFYTAVLGFTPGDAWPQDHPTFVILVRDDVTLHFYVADGAVSVDSGAIYIDADNGEQEFERLAGRVAVDWGPEVYWYGRYEFSFKDPNGYDIVISQETDRTPTCSEDG